MLLEKAVSAALEAQAYLRMGRFTYRAAWSTSDVEHLLFLSRWGAGKAFLSADFGIRNPGAEAFAIDCVRAYGGDLYRIMKNDPGMDCTMRFSLGKLAGWSPRWSIHIPTMPVSSLAERIGDDVRQFLLPIVSGVTDQRTLFSLLLQDAEPCPWYRVNGAIRAAQVACLASRLGMDSQQIIATLLPLARQVKAGLAGDATPVSYIEAVVRRAQAIIPR